MVNNRFSITGLLQMNCTRLSLGAIFLTVLALIGCDSSGSNPNSTTPASNATTPELQHSNSFVNFESGQVRPLALSDDGARLYATNTPNDTLDIEAQSGITDFGLFIDQALDQLQQTLGSRMDSGSINQQGPLFWATADEGATGYLFIENMAGFTEDASAYEDLLAARQAMDQAMSELATTTRMIVDVRINGGGLDAIALDFASRFVSNQQLAFSKTARGRDFESNPVEAYLIPPDTGAYLNPVTLIVGADTRGAAEVFAIPMHHQPQVTVIGEHTAGALSDVLVKPLPNGWVTALSNEVYLDSQGVSFEHVGLRPEINVPVFQLDAIFAGEDPALDLALSMQ